MGTFLYFGGHGHTHLGISNHSHSHSTNFNDRQALLNNSHFENAAISHKQETNINVRAAFIHVLGDLIQSVGVLIAALLILWKVYFY